MGRRLAGTGGDADRASSVPRRYSSLEVLFDTLKYHGSAFTIEFWTRIFDSVLLPIFDHVRAEVCGSAHVLSAVCRSLLQRSGRKERHD